MTEEVDPYDKGREAFKELYEVLEGQIVQNVNIKDKGQNYPEVDMLITEYPIQEISTFPKDVIVDGEKFSEMGVEAGDSKYYSEIRLDNVRRPETEEGHGLVLEFKTEDRTDCVY